ncbi:MAG: mucin desulfatase, partial [Clostridiales bacterium]|nr:mucin desulfatase [Clostridiales bacterium]
MFDSKTHEGICVVDLDTVMPGLSLYDFGDSIRFGASTAAEDEKNLDNVEMSLELYESYVRGYL